MMFDCALLGEEATEPPRKRPRLDPALAPSASSLATSTLALDRVDVVLISEPRFAQALPLLPGPPLVLCTAPCAGLLRALVAAPSLPPAPSASLDAPSSSPPSRALPPLQVVAYGEVRTVGALEFVAQPSGTGLGHAAWVVRRKATPHSPPLLLYLVPGPPSSLSPPLPRSLLSQAHALLVSLPPIGGPLTLPELCQRLGASLSAGGCLVLPLEVSSFTLELVEALLAALPAQSLSHVPVLWADPVAAQYLALAQVSAESLPSLRQTRVLQGERPLLPQSVPTLKLLPVPTSAAFERAWSTPCVLVATPEHVPAIVRALARSVSPGAHTLLLPDQTTPPPVSLGPLRLLRLPLRSLAPSTLAALVGSLNPARLFLDSPLQHPLGTTAQVPSIVLPCWVSA